MTRSGYHKYESATLHKKCLDGNGAKSENVRNRGYKNFSYEKEVG